MELKSSRSFMITNRGLNGIIKPNFNMGELNKNQDSYNDAAISILDGKINHQTAIVFDIIFDRMYRLFNENEDYEYIHSSLKKLLDRDISKKHFYFQKYITNLKMDFYYKVKGLINLLTKNPGTILHYNDETLEFLLKAGSDIIDNAFPIEFSFIYKNLLRKISESKTSFNEVIILLNAFEFEKSFFLYLLKSIFNTRIPGWTFRLDIKLDEIFENNERSIYNIKQWFIDAQSLKLNMIFPLTCFYNSLELYQTAPKQLFFRTISHPLFDTQPIQDVSYNKSASTISLNLRNNFMLFYSHDARMCSGTYIPSSLYKMNSNTFFIGKGIINHTYYNSKEKAYKNKLKYTMNEIYSMLNLTAKDLTGNNASHRRKAAFKSLEKLNEENIIDIDRLTSERVLLNSVWNIATNKC